MSNKTKSKQNNKRTIADYFSHQTNSDDTQPSRKRMKLSSQSNELPTIPQQNNRSENKDNEQIEIRSKQRIQQLKQQKLKEQKEQQLKEELREEITEKIINMTRNARSDPIRLIKLCCPTLEIKHDISSNSEIQKAFKTALKHCHPDKAANKSLKEKVKSEEIFKLLCAEKEKYKHNSDNVRIGSTKKPKTKNNTNFEKYYRNKIFIPSDNKVFDVKIILSDDRNFVYVKGKTFPIKEQLIEIGLGWNHKEKAWQIKLPYFTDDMRVRIESVCKNKGYLVGVFIGCRDMNLPSQNYDFRIWYEKDLKMIYVTPCRNMNDFWRTEGFMCVDDGIWVQTECVFYEEYLNVIKNKARENGLVFEYCNVQKNPKCKVCNGGMRIYTTRKGAEWNYGRKFFRCWKCKDSEGSFLWVDGTEPYSDAAFRRCGECSTEFYGYADECRMM
eukprot:317305_1